jgi:hypothetical protein
LWELLTRESPWKGLSNLQVRSPSPNWTTTIVMITNNKHKQVIARVGHAGERLPLPDTPPRGCPPKYLTLIKECWEDSPSKRPRFKAILNTLRDMTTKWTEDPCFFKISPFFSYCNW